MALWSQANHRARVGASGGVWIWWQGVQIQLRGVDPVAVWRDLAAGVVDPVAGRRISGSAEENRGGFASGVRGEEVKEARARRRRRPVKWDLGLGLWFP